MSKEEREATRAWAIAYLQFTIEDIARTKKQTLTINYYGAVLQGSIIFLVKAFNELPTANCNVFLVLLVISPATAILNIIFTIQGMSTLREFRNKLDYIAKNFWPAEIRAIPPRAGKVYLLPRKRTKDLLLNTFYLVLPIGGAMFACWFLLITASSRCSLPWK